MATGIDVTGSGYSGNLITRAVRVSNETIAYAPISIYAVEEFSERLRIIRSSIERNVVSQISIPISFISANSIEKIFDIIPIKRGSTSTVIYEYSPAFVVTFNPTYMEGFFKSMNTNADKRYIEIHRLLAVFNIASKNFCNIVSQVDTKDVNALETYTAVDLDQFGDRNMLQFCAYAPNKFESARWRLEANRIYVKHDPIVLQNTINSDLPMQIRETKESYDDYTVPFANVELLTFAISSGLLAEQYCHPQVAFEYLSRLCPPNLTINVESVRKIRSYGRGALMPRPVIERLDYSVVYKSPKAVKNMFERMANDATVSLLVRNVYEVTGDINQITRQSSNTSTLISEALESLDTPALNQFVLALLQAVTNVNLVIVDIGAISIDAFDNFVVGICILTMQALLPPTAVPPETRIHINNAFCRYLLRYVGNPEFLRQAVAARRVPNLSDICKWNDHTVDRLAILYDYVRPQNGEIYNRLYDYYKGHTSAVVQHVLLTSDQSVYNIPETMSISIPWLMGNPINALASDKRTERMQVDLDLPQRFPVLIATVNVRGEIDMSHIDAKYDLIDRLYVGNLAQTPPFLQSGRGTSIAFIQHLAKERYRLQAILEAILSNTYAMGLNTYCDSVMHSVSTHLRRVIMVRPKAILFGILGLRPKESIIPDRIPDFYGGAEDVLILILIYRIYRMLEEKISQHEGERFLQGTLITFTGEIVSNIVIREVDVRSYFTTSLDSTTFDSPLWKDFLRGGFNTRLPKSYEDLFQAVMRLGPTIENLLPMMPYVDYFYIVRRGGYVAAGSRNTILAMNTVYEKQLEVVETIDGFNSLVRYWRDIRRVGNNASTNMLSSKFSKLKSISEDEFIRMDADGFTVQLTSRIPAIKVNMRAKYSLSLIKESGAFTAQSVKNMKYSELVSTIEKNHLQDFPPIITIPITVVLNDLGITETTKLQCDVLDYDNYYREFVRAEVIVPVDFVNINVIDDYQLLLQTFSTNVQVRKTQFEMVKDIDFRFEQVSSISTLPDLTD